MASIDLKKVYRDQYTARVGQPSLVEVPERTAGRDENSALIAFPGGTVTVTAPGDWVLAEPQPGVTLARAAGGLTLSVPGGVRSVTLTRRGG